VKNDQHKTTKIKKEKTDSMISPFVKPLFIPTPLEKVSLASLYVVVEIVVKYLYVVVQFEL
jgi:hypothetical protein